MLELNHCTTGRALVVIANMAMEASGDERLSKVWASVHITPQAVLLSKHMLCVDPKQRPSSPPPLWMFFLHLSSACLGEADEEASREK